MSHFVRNDKFGKEFQLHNTRRLEYIAYATCLDDLRVPPSNRLHRLRGDREDQYSISINDQWRICFRFKDGDAYGVEITDYH
ncbi:MAG: plasmid maintenance system killer [Deltaproteobacteria bacterium HGW-Deltaproteobacteria-21]|nr:MAG: plasmid maintenance system killer [Deltaproteobacteria bacterium HGW-Deltaproteobacteria-21]